MLCFTFRGSLKPPWSRRRRKGALSPQQWRRMFTPDGKLRDGGVKFLKIVRNGVSHYSVLCFSDMICLRCSHCVFERTQCLFFLAFWMLEINESMIPPIVAPGTQAR